MIWETLRRVFGRTLPPPEPVAPPPAAAPQLPKPPADDVKLRATIDRQQAIYNRVGRVERLMRAELRTFRREGRGDD